MLYVIFSNEHFEGLRLRSGERTDESLLNAHVKYYSNGSGSGIIFGASSAHGCKKLTAELDFCVQPRIDFILNKICLYPHLPSVLGSRLAPDLSYQPCQQKFRVSGKGFRPSCVKDLTGRLLKWRPPVVKRTFKFTQSASSHWNVRGCTYF